MTWLNILKKVLKTLPSGVLSKLGSKLLEFNISVHLKQIFKSVLYKQIKFVQCYFLNKI